MKDVLDINKLIEAKEILDKSPVVPEIMYHYDFINRVWWKHTKDGSEIVDINEE